MSEPCILCGSAGTRPFCTAGDRLYGTTLDKFQVVACVGCGLLRLSPQPRNLHRFYPQTYWFAPDRTAAARGEEFYRSLVLRDHIAFVQRAIKDCPRGPVLDVGCGGGLFLAMLSRKGWRGMGLDSSPEAAAVAWRAKGVPAACASLESAPFPDAAFAAITMFHVLEHLPDPRPYLAAACRLLHPRGRLIVQVPNAACWQFALFGRRWNGLDVPRHLHNFRETDLVELLGRSGFAVVRRKHFSLRDNPAGLATTLAPSLDPMARRVRGRAESSAARLARDLVYFGLLVAGLPFTLAEAAFRRGSTVMLEARKV